MIMRAPPSIQRNRPRRPKAAILLLVPLFVATALIAGDAQGVAAHAALERADPPANSQLREPPDSFTLYFTEPLERRFSSVRVTDGSGTRIDERVEFDDRDPAAMRVVLKSKPSPGFLTVFWENVSTVDGHRITGSYPLTILNADGSVPPGQAQQAGAASISGTELNPARVATKWLLLIAGSVVAGSLAFVLAVDRHFPVPVEQAQARVWSNALQTAILGTCVLIGAGAAEVLNQAADLGGESDWGMLVLAFGAAATGLALGLCLRETLVSGHQSDRSSLPPGVVFLGLVGTGVSLGAGIGIVLGQSTEPSSNGLDNIATIVFKTEWGQRWLLRNIFLLPLLGLLLLSWRLNSPRARRYALVVGLAVSIAFLLVTSTVSHAAAVRIGSVWAISTDFSHLVAASVWTGMLLQLALFIAWVKRSFSRSERPRLLATALQRFSLVAVAAVSLLLLTGVVSTAIQLPHLSDLLDTGYGRTLLLKLALVAALLVVAGVNAYVFRPKLVSRAGTSDGRKVSEAWATVESKLGRYVKTELILLATILLAAGALAQVSPPASPTPANQATVGKFVATQDAAGISATLVVDPNEPGENAFEVYLTGGVDVVELVRLRFTGPDGFGSILTLDASNPPTFYAGRGAFLSIAGKWQVTADIRRTRGEDLAMPFELTVGNVVASDSPSDLAAPFSTSPRTLALLFASLLIAGLILAGSWQRPGRPAGYVGQAALRAARVRVPAILSLAVFVGAGLGIALAADQFRDRALSPEQASRGNPVDASPASIDRGRILFNRNCIQCHGETGRGDGELARTLPIPPANLYDHIPYHPDQFFFRVLANGLSGIMPGFASSLGEDERWDIMNFLRDQFGQPPADR